MPVSALFREGGKWATYVVTGDVAVLTGIEIGHRSADYAEVLSGLTGDEMVITHPGDRVVNGVLIINREDL